MLRCHLIEIIDKFGNIYEKKTCYQRVTMLRLLQKQAITVRHSKREGFSLLMIYPRV